MTDAGYPRRVVGWYVTGVLVIAYTVSYIDRTMLTMLVDPIRRTLHISDVQISLVQGLAFAVFYTVLGFPMGRLSDRYNRRNLIIFGALAWSVMTSLCGVARSFGHMFLARVGVGVGEATLSPSAYSILSDYFPPERRARPLSVYTSAIYLGAAAATFGGGALISSIHGARLPLVGVVEPWQIVFMLIGLLGIPVALMMATIPEPPRHGLLAAGATGAPLEALAMRTVLDYMWARRGAYFLLILGISAYSMMTNGLKAWIPTFLMRTFHWSPADVGVWFGLVLVVFGTGGTVCGGVLAVWLRDRGHPDANIRVSIAAALLVLPLGIAGPLMPSGALALTFYAAVMFLGGLPFGVAAAAIQEITPNQMRGQVSAVYLVGLNLAGIGTGPIFVAFLTQVVFGDDQAIRYALACLVGFAATLSSVLLTVGLRAYRRTLSESSF